MDEKSCWSIVAWSTCLCTAASKISRCLFPLFEGSRAPIFAKRWVTVWWNIYTGLAALHCKTVQVGHTNMRYAILPFGKAATFSFLGVQLTATFHQVLEICHLFIAIHDICESVIFQNMKSRNHTVQVLPVTASGCWHCCKEPQLPLQVISVAVASLKKRF